MTITPEHVEAFAPLAWATRYLTSPDWVVKYRGRGAGPGEDTDRFCRDTMSSHDGVQQWLELYEKPAPGAKITRSLSLCKFGTGLNGFPSICHGGALLTLMDEALAAVMVANETLETGIEFSKLDEGFWKRAQVDGRPVQEVLKGRMVTAKLDIKFLAPVLCPGIVGIEVDVLENRGHKMKITGTMKDVKGKPLLQAEGLWVKIGGAAKL
ncbi:hypothetical protein EJ02DRAFT_454678 [Clathrospora elynae]|uniref:Thioesterase domain-containing protein n=1 Tax=Clathrospora elynae TaxID=706981 RepID=A0A6A5SQP3_9PLEO|nr:hypothetical protein EJ02DRAFT_454678 [Clathrospora elynae]